MNRVEDQNINEMTLEMLFCLFLDVQLDHQKTQALIRNTNYFFIQLANDGLPISRLISTCVCQRPSCTPKYAVVFGFYQNNTQTLSKQLKKQLRQSQESDYFDPQIGQSMDVQNATSVDIWGHFQLVGSGC